MWSVAIASSDFSTISSLRECLQQTGMVETISEWRPSNQGEWRLRPGQTVPGVVVFGISPENIQAVIDFAAMLRKANPAVRMLACLPEERPDLSNALQGLRNGGSPSVPTIATKEAASLLFQLMRCGMQDVLPAPVTVSVLEEVLQRFTREDDEGPGSGEKVIGIMGAKGGVGTTTIAVHLGIELAEITKKRVVLLDFARPLGHVPLLLDLQPRFSIQDAIENLDRLDGHFFSGLLTRHASGLDVLAGVGQARQWQQIPLSSISRILNVAQSSADFVLIDYGSSYSMDWDPLVRLAGAVLLVTEADVPSLWALERMAGALAPLGPDPEWLRVVINRWTEKDDATLKTVERNLKRGTWARFPNNFKLVSQAVNSGSPLAGNSKNGLGAAFQKAARQLAGLPLEKGKTNRGWFFTAKAK